MDDSDLDFTDLCSRLLKRVRRKGAGRSGDEKKPAANDEDQSSPRRNPPKRRKKTKDIKTEIKIDPNERIQPGDVPQPAPAVPEPTRVKDVVILRMQQFKRSSPQRLLHTDTDQPTTSQADINNAEVQHSEDVSSDEALALQLQEELDREARPAVDDGGLFFCQLCQKDLSPMSSQLRTQHINRCLDAGEVSAPSTSHQSHPRPHVPECPICGKSFKSEKARSVHLKRCSTDMGVSPNDLLQALRRQAADAVGDGTTEQSRPTGVTKRRNGAPAKKKSRRKGQPLDEDTMMALALSRSLLEQEKEKKREMKEEREIQAQLSSPPALRWKPGAGKGRGKRRKGASPVQPPLLLVQDPQTALNRLQERVSSLLLCSRSPSPPTPTLSPSTLPDSSQAPLWLKSALHGGGPDSVLEFYTSELSDFIQPLIAPEKEKLKNLEVTPVKKPPAPTTETAQEVCPDQIPAQHRSALSPLTPCSGTPGTQALQDLMDLAEEGMTLTQYGYNTNTATDKDNDVNELPSSGFVPETNNKTIKTPSVSFSKLASDLSSMVNNPQLSNVQLQVDSGDVFFTHSFMLYTRCPLLANMVYDSGFGVQEEGMPVSQRVLLGDVPGAAVLALLKYLYTAHCPLTRSLLPHVQQLADRFCLAELQQQCEEYSRTSEEDPRGESEGMFSAQEPHLSEKEDQNLAESNFLELLQSMWQHEDSEGENEFKEDAGERRGVEEEAERVDVEYKEDRVDEEELDEIYEFAATQKKIENTLETATETEEDEGDTNKSVRNEKEDEGISENETESRWEKSVASFHCKEGVDGTEAAMVTSLAEIHQKQNPDTGPKVCLLSESDAPENNNKDVSLDKSYNRLFSQSVGEYTEPSQTATSCQQHYTSSHTPQRKTPVFRPSFASEVIDLSISPPPSSSVSGESSFPVPGVSPGPSPGPDNEMGLSEQSCHRNPPSPSESHSKQVELIVLSDSSDQMDVEPEGGGLSPQSPSGSLPDSAFKSRSNVCESKLDTPNSFVSAFQSHTGKQVNIDTELKSDQSEHHSPCAANQSVFDGSAEVSWLIPATPVPVARSSSAQTCVSMRRTQLFPKSCSSSSSSSSTVFNASKSSANNGYAGENPEPSSKPLSNCPLNSDQSPTKEHFSKNVKRSPGYQTPLHLLRLSQIPSKRLSDGSHAGFINGHPSQSVRQPASSTPLHSDSSLQRQTLSVGQQASLSLQLSHSESYQSLAKLQRRREITVIFSMGPLISHQTLQAIIILKVKRECARTNGVGDEVQNHSVEEVNVEEISPQASFCVMDEPPIPFDDSWGLDGNVGSQKPCFSLRLDSSEGTVSPARTESRRPEASTRTKSPAAGAQMKTPEPSPGPFNHSLPDPDMWDDWEEKEEELLPLSQRLAPPSAKRVAALKTPVACRNRNEAPLIPITPMPGFSDMDTPELKNRLNRFGVRPLPKKHMVLKLKEIHQYTHQLQSSESEEETCPPLHASKSQSAQLSFKQPTAPPAVSSAKPQASDEDELLSASQNSTTSSTAESDRSNPELCVSEGDDSDSEGITSSQAVVREKDKLLAVRRFILSDPKLHGRVLQYQPIPLVELQASLKAAGIRLGAPKLLDFLDSQCITFSTAKQGQNTSSRRKQKRKVGTSGPGDAAVNRRKKAAKPNKAISVA
ncbi:LOW QUALITY PROTEIN: structure-specific endonuclease subunit SLX4 [Triplophysa dalaica]|uniref:LOW QUALITY PROTEIN: structure-specific endonuclease subunit SLX4 n=1 Tax=Triplophysa dalaica TaxID=1582913 RepID=UPI0024DF5BE4|nr:LOW QUALITY PROTEIN: structure-specific endonuclease subunit SLX4 [Triplophysa dalaica]